MRVASLSISILIFMTSATSAAGIGGMGSVPYDSFEEPDVCADCHVRFTTQHEAALMHQSYTHHWDEIEYFELALPHSEKLDKVAGIKAGCNGCHAPLAFLDGDIPPKPPAEGTRANEGVSCHLCHSIVGHDGDVPFNGNFLVDTDSGMQGTRPGRESAYHEIVVNEYLGTADFCGTCHNEQDPYGMWVKATHLEWQDGPWAARGVQCQDCHMPRAETAAADGEEILPDARQHLFHGAHDASKLAGAVEVLLYCDDETVAAGNEIVIDAMVVNAKAGHMIPSGSVEERVVFLHVEATDSAGNTFHLPVDRKGFEGEDWTIASSNAMAYQDLGDIQGIDGWKGLPRDGDVPDGDRIFRMPYLDPNGNMTVAQWHTASFGVDYRLPPLKAIPETFTWTVPDDAAPGPLTVEAKVYYQRVVASVVEHMEIPDEARTHEEMGVATLGLNVQ